MKKNVIVSLADANYFPLLDELINSIKRFKESSGVAICILDAGLTKEQKEKLSNNPSLPTPHGNLARLNMVMIIYQNVQTVIKIVAYLSCQSIFS